MILEKQFLLCISLGKVISPFPNNRVWHSTARKIIHKKTSKTAASLPAVDV